MEHSAHELLSAWEAYYVITGTSAAALTGLQFVVMALIADTPGVGATESVAAFGTPTVVHFCISLLVAVAVSAPWPTLTPLIVLLMGTAIVGLAYSAIVARRARRQSDYTPVLEDWIWHVILPMSSYAVLLGAAAFMHAAAVTSLFFVGAVAILLIFIGIHNAWDTVAYIAVQYRKDHSVES